MQEQSSRETRLASAATSVVVGAAVLLTLVTHAPGRGHMLRWLLGVVSAALAAGTFLTVRGRVLSHRPSRTAWWCCVVAALVGLCAMGTAAQWAGLGVVLAGLALGAPSARVGALALIILLAGMGVVLVATDTARTSTVAILITSSLVGLVLYVLARLTVLTDDLRRSQAEVARLEVEQERARISRDLHDVIGRTMTAASLRNQTALALVGLAPDKAAEQIQATHDALAQGQARLREITSGPVVAGLSQELDATSGLCQQLGIALDLHADQVGDPDASRLAARVVREAVTNMLKHSRPRHCTVVVQATDLVVRVTVENDGCPDLPARSSGTGLHDLAHRLGQAGGRLDTHQTGGHFVVTCQIPTPPEQP